VSFARSLWEQKHAPHATASTARLRKCQAGFDTAVAGQRQNIGAEQAIGPGFKQAESELLLLLNQNKKHWDTFSLAQPFTAG